MMTKEELSKFRSERMKGNFLFKGKVHTAETKRLMSRKSLGENNSNWKGGRTVSGGGYIMVLCKNHPYSDVNGRVKEERLVIEKHINRYLKREEIIHHKNRDKKDNRIENLQIVSTKEHAEIHHSGNKYNLNRKVSKKTRFKISQALKGHPVSEKTREKISLSQKGKKVLEETKIKISKSHIGLKNSIQTRLKKSISAKKAWKKRK